MGEPRRVTEAEVGRGGERASSPLSVLHVARPASGGMVTHLRLLLPRLSERCVRLGVACPESLDRGALGGNLGATRVFPAPIRAHPHPADDLRAARIIAGVARGSGGFGLLHGHGLRGAWIAALAARLAGNPFLFTAHNLAPSKAGLLSRLALRFVLRRAAAVICVSEAVAESLVRYGLRAGCARVIPNGIDLAPFDLARDRSEARRELGVEEDAPLVVSVGRLSKEKGFDGLVRAAAILLKERGDAAATTRFLLAGSGPERGPLEAAVAGIGVAERFRLLGRYEDVPGLLCAADVVVIPSLEEGQGLVALEAMAARRPVIASRVGGLSETVVEEATGLFVPAGDGAALAAAIRRLLGDAEARRRMGDAGRERVEALYNADRMAASTLAVFRELC